MGDEPRDDLCDITTAEERLEMLSLLTERAWLLTGMPMTARRCRPA